MLEVVKTHAEATIKRMKKRNPQQYSRKLMIKKITKKLSTKEALSKVPTTAEALTVEGSYVNSTRA